MKIQKIQDFEFFKRRAKILQENASLVTNTDFNMYLEEEMFNQIHALPFPGEKIIAENPSTEMIETASIPIKVLEPSSVERKQIKKTIKDILLKIPLEDATPLENLWLKNRDPFFKILQIPHAIFHYYYDTMRGKYSVKQRLAESMINGDTYEWCQRGEVAMADIFNKDYKMFIVFKKALSKFELISEIVQFRSTLINSMYPHSWPIEKRFVDFLEKAVSDYEWSMEYRARLKKQSNAAEVFFE